MTRKYREKKTRYCTYFFDCDRPENCFEGELCSFFKPNPDIPPANKEEGNNDLGIGGLKDIMDNIWDGKKQHTYNRK
jgi:hypothetical protein